MRHRNSSRWPVDQRRQPSGYPLGEVDDGLPAVRRPGRFGQPHLEVRRGYGIQFLTAPVPAVKVGQPRLGGGVQAQLFCGLPGPLLGPGEMP